MNGSRRLVIACCAVVVLMVAGLLVFRAVTRKEAPDAPAEFEGRAAVAALVGEVPQHDMTLGDPTAPVSVVEYIDVKCPTCGEAAEEVTPTLITDYVTPGRITLTLRPLAFLGPDSRTGALAVLAAARQDRAWQFSELVLRNQGPEDVRWVTLEFVVAAATAGGLDTARLRRDLERPEVAARLRENQRHAELDAARSTPYWVVRGPRGVRSVAGAKRDAVLAAIAEVAPAP